MKLSHKELEIQSGHFGEVRKLALEHQMQVGKFFDAQSFVEISPVSYTHLTLPTKLAV